MGGAGVLILVYCMGGRFSNVREMAVTIGLFILALVNFAALLNLIPQLSARRKWVIYLTVNAIIAVGSSFGLMNLQSMLFYLPVICLTLMLLNILLFVLPRLTALR
jgi:hypothetical protein